MKKDKEKHYTETHRRIVSLCLRIAFAVVLFTTILCMVEDTRNNTPDVVDMEEYKED